MQPRRLSEANRQPGSVGDRRRAGGEHQRWCCANTPVTKGCGAGHELVRDDPERPPIDDAAVPIVVLGVELREEKEGEIEARAAADRY